MSENINRWRYISINLNEELFYVHDYLLNKEVKFFMPDIISVEIEGDFAIAKSKHNVMHIKLSDGSRKLIK